MSNTLSFLGLTAGVGYAFCFAEGEVPYAGHGPDGALAPGRTVPSTLKPLYTDHFCDIDDRLRPPGSGSECLSPIFPTLVQCLDCTKAEPGTTNLEDLARHSKPTELEQLSNFNYLGVPWSPIEEYDQGSC